MLYDHCGHRKYLTASERRRFVEAAQRQPPDVETFCLVLAHSGARVSEVLALRMGSIDPAAGVLVFESLKKRRKGIYRQVPVSRPLLSRLDAVHDFTRTDPEQRLWDWCRTTAWKHVKEVMEDADIPAFCAMPKALRHAFGVFGVSEARVPLNMMQKWLGHARIETTAIYANAVGPEERAIARRMWN